MENFILKLFVSDNSVNNEVKINNFKVLLEKKLGDNFSLEVIDVVKNPELAQGEQIIGTPILVKMLPQPAQKVILNFSDEEKLLLGMNLLIK